MKTTIKNLILCVAFALCAANALAQTSSFTYQGKLTDGGTVASGPYDFIFRLFTATSGGTQVGTDVTVGDVQVTAGIFTVNLDFGSPAFTSTNANALEISVRPGASTGAYTPLSPLQPLTSSPYAVQTIRAASAAVADNANQLGGVAANQYVQTGDTRLSDARMPTAGSADYVQSNPASAQPGTSLNIGGNATAGGTLAGNVVNATTQFNIDGNRVLSVPASNLFVGLNSGQSHTTGHSNSFVGTSAGFQNTTGVNNSFFGSGAGQANTTGNFNSFFGSNAGFSSTGSSSGANSFFGSGAGFYTTGNGNSFFGANAGLFNTSGSSNSFFGLQTGQNNTTGGFNSFFGTDAGISNTTGGLNSFYGGNSGRTNTTGIYNSFFGIDSGTSNTTGDRNAFVGSVAGRSNTTGARNSFFGTDAGFSNTTGSDNTVAGMEAGFSNTTGSQNVFIGRQAGYANTTGGNNTVIGTLANVASNNLTFATAIGSGAVASASNSLVLGRAADTVQIPGSLNITSVATTNILNALTQYNIGGTRVLSVAGNSNVFAGVGSGAVNTGASNAFFGTQAGEANTTANNNSFFGRSAGRANTLGDSNSFFGAFAGSANTTGQLNSFFGTIAGESNTTGQGNSIFGGFAGTATTDGSSNSFFGVRAGEQNTSGIANSFFGGSAGSSTTLGYVNTFIGSSAGDTNTTGFSNTIIGSSADVGSGNLDHATAIGADSVVSTSATVVLGRTVDTVQVPGNLNVAGNLTGNFTVPAANITGVLAPANGGTGAPGASGNFLRSNGATWASSAIQASDIPTGSTNYVQNIPGIGTQSASFNIDGGGTANIFNATTQYNIGGNRVLSVAGLNNLFVGVSAGPVNTASQNTFVGILAGLNNTTGSENSFFGFDAGRDNTMGGNNAFFGSDSGVFNTTGSENSFFGKNAGTFNSTGSSNSFFGRTAGYQTRGSYNSFFGEAAGTSTTFGEFNSFFGRFAGASNTTGSSNTIIGGSANVGANNLINATAIGANAVVSQSNSLVLGSGVNVGIGTSAPQYKLHVVGENVRVEGNTTGTLPRFSMNFTGGLSDEKKWQNYAAANRLSFTSLNDAENAETFWLLVTRGTGTAISSVTFPNGNVGIGTTTPEQKLHVDGTSEILSTGTGAGFKFRDRGSTSFTDDWVWYSQGNAARLFEAGSGDLLKVTTSGRVYIPRIDGGLVLRSPSGQCWAISIADNGQFLPATAIACP